MIKWPDPLVRDMLARKVVIFLGGGVSRNAISRDGRRRPPLWEDFLRSGLARIGSLGTQHIKSAISNKDYLHACEWIKAKLDDDWEDFLRSELVDPQYQAADIHDVLFRLDQRIYISPNFDTIFDNYVVAQTGGQVSVKRHCDNDVHNFLRDEQLHIIKIHGSILHPNEIIFSQKDYAEARIKYSSFYDAIDACLLSHTFLFLGCGISDPDVNLLLENQRFSFPFARPHYFVTSNGMNADLSRSLRQNRNLKCLTYSSKDNHVELLDSLRALLEELETPSAQEMTAAM